MSTDGTPVTQLLTALQTQAESVDGILLVEQGHIEYPDGYNFDDAIRELEDESQGAFAFWMSDRQAGNNVSPGSVEVKGNLFISFAGVEASDGSATTNMHTAIDLAEELLAALVSKSALLAVKSKLISGNYLQVESTIRDGIFRFLFTLSFTCGLAACD